jgi:hypothetical protein
VGLQGEPQDHLRALLSWWDFLRETKKLRRRMCNVVKKKGDPMSKPLNEYDVLYRTLLKLCCPEMIEAKINEVAGEAQRAILEHFLEPIERKKFKRNLSTESESM